MSLLPGTVKQGYLTKSPPLDKGTSVFKAWKKRWCILYLSHRELFIQYYENEDSARGSSPPKSTVSLRFCEKVDANLDHSSYKNVFGLYLPERAYYFSAPSHYEMNEWVDAICAHLNLSRDHQSEPSNHYITSPLSTSTSITSPIPTFNTLPTLTPPPPGNFSPSPTLPVRNISPGIYSTQSQYSCLTHNSGMLPSEMISSSYGTLGTSPSSNYGLVSSGSYGTLGTARGPPPSPPPPYAGNLSEHIDRTVSLRPLVPSPNASVERIQQRSLPPIPPSSSTPSSTSTPSTPTSNLPTPPSVPPRRSGQQQLENNQEPPVPPPRQGGKAVVSNLYVSATHAR